MAFEDWPFTDSWSLHGNKEIVSRYEILERLGEGTFGEVFKARRREDSLIVALKEIHNSDSSCREVRALLLLDHPNVIKLHEYFVQGSNMVLVLEYLPYNLYEVIRAGKGDLSEGAVKGWTVQILRGLAACHAASILHRDLKPNNLLISGDGTLKIADFGQARVVPRASRNEGGLYGSENPENGVAGSEDHSIQDVPSRRDNQDLEFQADGPVAEGDGGEGVGVSMEHVELQMQIGRSEASGEFGMEIGDSAGKRNSAQDAMERIAEFGTPNSVLRASQDLGRNGSHVASGPTNVGYSALADAVKDARNYFTVEEMVRTETGIDRLGMSGLQRNQVTGSQQGEDPSCCGWFPLENVEQHSDMTGVTLLAQGNGIAVKEDTLLAERGDSGEREGDVSSDESDVDWKGQYGIRTEDLIDTLKKTEETQKPGASAGLGKGEGDLLQKLRRFIRKRTEHRRLNTEGKIVGPVHLKNERFSRGGGGYTLHPHRSPVSKKAPSIERNSVNVKSVPSAMSTRSASGDENMVCFLGQQVYPGAQVRKGTNDFDEKERRNSKRFTNGHCQDPQLEGGGPENMDDASAVAGVKDGHSTPQNLRKEVTRQITNGQTKMEDSEYDDFMEGGENGYLRDESGRKLYGGLQEAKMESKRSSTLVSKGTLREMAYGSVHDVGMTICKGQGELKDDFQGVEREFIEAEAYSGGAHTVSMNLEKSNGYLMDATRQVRNGERVQGFPWSDGKRLELAAGLNEEVMESNESAVLRTAGMGSKDRNSVGEMVHERWDRNSGELIPSKDVCKSWEQMEGCSSVLSDAEGTRWYGAPEFQYSYMDSKKVDYAEGKGSGETCGVPAGSEEEWEDGSEGGAYLKGGGVSQGSSGRGDNLSEDGSTFTTMVGTRWYKAPELLYGATKYGKGVDIWAVGCIFGELLSGKAIFPGLNDIDQLSRLVRILGAPTERVWAGVSLLPDFNKICFVDDRSPLTLKNYLPNISEFALHFLQKLLTYDPELRPSAEEAAEDGFFFMHPLPYPCHELQLPTMEESEASDEEWGDWKDPGSPFSDFEILG